MFVVGEDFDTLVLRTYELVVIVDVVFSDTIEVNVVAGSILRDFDQVAVLTDAHKVVRNIDTVLVLLGVLGITIFIAPLVKVLYKLVVSHTSLHEVVSHKLVHCVVLVFEVVLSIIAVDSYAVRLYSSNNGIGVRDRLRLFIVNRCGNAPFLLEDVIRFHKTGKSKITMCCSGYKTLHTRNAMGFSFAFYLFVFAVDAFVEFVCPTGCLQQSAHDAHVGGTSNQTGNALIGRSDNRSHGMYITIAQFGITLLNTRSTIDEVVRNNGLLQRVGYFLTGDATVVEVALGKGTAFCGEQRAVISRFITVVNHTAVSNELCLFVGQVCDALRLTENFGHISGHGLIGRCKDGVVTTSRKNCCHCGGINFVTQTNTIKDSFDLCEFFVRSEVIANSLLLGNGKIAFIDLLAATLSREQKTEGQCNRSAIGGQGT